VTDVVKFPMSADGANQLGYAGSLEVRLPAAMLALVPVGPVLDPQPWSVWRRRLGSRTTRDDARSDRRG
jgi:hypothetical protein